MLRIFGFLLGVLVCDLIAMALIIVTECIKDVLRKPKHGSRSASRGSTSREDCEMPHAGRCNRYNVPHSSARMHATASRMAQEAHDTAVRDSHSGYTTMPAVWPTRATTQPCLTIKQQLIFMITLFQILALDAVARFFDMTLVDIAVTIRNEYLILKYTDILMRINEFAILYDWGFDRSAEYLLLTKRERRDCINIIEINQGSTAEKIRNTLIFRSKYEI